MDGRAGPAADGPLSAPAEIEGADAPTARSRGRSSSTRAPSVRIVALGIGFALAIVASFAVFVTDNPLYLRLALLGVAWAFVIAVIAAGGRRADQIAATSREQDLRHTYDLELEREVAARREYELRLENELRKEAQDAMRAEVEAMRRDLSSLAQLRGELQGLAALRSDLRQDMTNLRAELTDQLSGEMLVERIVMRTQSIRMPEDRPGLELRNAPALQGATAWDPPWSGDDEPEPEPVPTAPEPSATRPPRARPSPTGAFRMPPPSVPAYDADGDGGDPVPEVEHAQAPGWGAAPVAEAGAGWSATTGWGAAVEPAASAPLRPVPPPDRPAPVRAALPPLPPLESFLDHTPDEQPADDGSWAWSDPAAHESWGEADAGRYQDGAWEDDAVDGWPGTDSWPATEQPRPDDGVHDRADDRTDDVQPMSGRFAVPSPVPRPEPVPNTAEEADRYAGSSWSDPSLLPSAEPAGHQRLQEILAESGISATGGRRRRHHRAEGEPADDVLARVLGRE